MDIYFNSFFVIQSLDESEPQTGTSLYNDSLKYIPWKINGMKSSLFDVRGRSEFEHLMIEIVKKAKTEGVRSFLHFEMHGSTSGLHFLNREMISWEGLYIHFVRINEIMMNNLFVSLACCYGAYIFNIIDPTKRAPFFCFVAPPNKINIQMIEIDFNAFFNTLISSRDINEAVDALNRNDIPRYMCYTSETVFDMVAEKWLAKSGAPGYVSKRLRFLYQQSRQMSEINMNRASKRKFLKNTIKDQSGDIRRMKTHFLFRDI